MISKDLSEYLSTLIAKVQCLIEASQRKSNILSKKVSEENGADCCKEILQLCGNVKHNFEIFEDDLSKRAIKEGLGILKDHSSENVTSEENGPCICLKFNDTFKQEKIEDIDSDSIDHFWSYLSNCCKRYSHIKANVNVTASKRTNETRKKAIDDPILEQLREIFGDDSEYESSFSSSSKEVLLVEEPEETGNKFPLEPDKISSLGEKSDEIPQECATISDENLPANVCEVGDSQCETTKITESLQEDFSTIVNEEFYCEASTSKVQLQDESSQMGSTQQSESSGISIESILKVIEIAAEDSNGTKADEEISVQNHDFAAVLEEQTDSLEVEKITNVANIEVSITENNSEKNPERFEKSEILVQSETDCTLTKDKETDLDLTLEKIPIASEPEPSTSRIDDVQELSAVKTDEESEVFLLNDSISEPAEPACPHSELGKTGTASEAEASISKNVAQEIAAVKDLQLEKITTTSEAESSTPKDIAKEVSDKKVGDSENVLPDLNDCISISDKSPDSQLEHPVAESSTSKSNTQDNLQGDSENVVPDLNVTISISDESPDSQLEHQTEGYETETSTPKDITQDEQEGNSENFVPDLNDSISISDKSPDSQLELHTADFEIEASTSKDNPEEKSNSSRLPATGNTNTIDKPTDFRIEVEEMTTSENIEESTTSLVAKEILASQDEELFSQKTIIDSCNSEADELFLEITAVCEGTKPIEEVEADSTINSPETCLSTQEDSVEAKSPQAPVTECQDDKTDQIAKISSSICVETDPDREDPEKREFLSNLGLENVDNYDKARNIRDELMDVAAEVACRPDSEGEYSVANYKSTSSDSDAFESKRYTRKTVKDALKYLENSGSSSDSGSIISLRSDDLFLTDTDEDLKLELSRKTKRKAATSSDDSTKPSKSNDAVEKFVPKKCYVNLERVDFSEYQRTQQTISKETGTKDDSTRDVIKDCFVRLETLRLLRVSSDSEFESTDSSKDEDGEIARLCDLSNLDKRKKSTSSDSSDKEKTKKRKRYKRKRKLLDVSGSETPDLSGYSTMSEDEFEKDRESYVDKDVISTVLDPNELLTEIICHTIHDSDSDTSSSAGDSDSKNKNRMARLSRTKIKTEDGDDGESPKNQHSWRNDSLLTGRLEVSRGRVKKENNAAPKRKRGSIKDSDSDDSRKSKRTSKKLKLLSSDSESEYSPSSDSEDDDSPPRKREPKMSFHNSDDDFVDLTGPSPVKTTVVNIDSEEEFEKKPTRRNILSVLSQKSLKQETQRAAKEEEERVERLEKRNRIRSSQTQSEIEDCLVLDTSVVDGFSITVDPVLSKRMFPHQVAGVKFMFDACYESIDTLKTFEGTGCILAHNMGLGKTFQVVALVHTLFTHPDTDTKFVLVVCPLSTVSGWGKEFRENFKKATRKADASIIIIEGNASPETRLACVDRWRKNGGVLILGYEAFEKLSKKRGKQLLNPGPDLVICDEGHLLKNGKSLRTKALMEIKTKRRIALTGTPLQNNLIEYYHMVQFVKPNLLGTNHEFKRQFANPILNGQYEDSSEGDITLMKKRTHVLHRLLKNTVQRYEHKELKKYLKTMQDYALFIQLHPKQEELYRLFIEMARSRKVEKNLKQMKSFFSDYQVTKYISSHPQLLHTMEAQNAQRKKKVIKETDTISEEPEVQEVEGIPVGWWKSLCPEEIKTTIEFGTKLHVMMGIIEEAEKMKEKVLIFTSSLVELSSIEYFLKLKGTPNCPSWKPRRDYFRMDGTVSPSVRTQMCDLFNEKKNETLRLFIMSHKVGGLGLNLTAATRIILLGANFNPSYDTQSIYRAYRFGQEANVYVYRLISMGTMEEKIYHRGVTKSAIASRVVDKHQIARHYKNLDLDDIYTINIDLSLERTVPAVPDDTLLSNLLLRFECIHKYHHHRKLLENRPDEDLNEEDKMKAWEEFKQLSEREKQQKKAAEANKAAFGPVAPPSIAELTEKRWNQINQPGPSNIPPEPSDIEFQRQWQQYVYNNFSSDNNSSTRPAAAGTSNMIPNSPAAENSVNNLTSKVINEILQNVSNNFTKGLNNSKTKPISSVIGPNPFVLGKFLKKKENLASKTGVIPWRTTSSDDFHKSTFPPRPKSNPKFISLLSDSSSSKVPIHPQPTRELNTSTPTNVVPPSSSRLPPFIADVVKNSAFKTNLTPGTTPSVFKTMTVVPHTSHTPINNRRSFFSDKSSSKVPNYIAASSKGVNGSTQKNVDAASSSSISLIDNDKVDGSLTSKIGTNQHKRRTYVDIIKRNLLNDSMTPISNPNTPLYSNNTSSEVPRRRTVDDDVIVVLDSTENLTEASSRSMNLQQTIRKLKRNKISVSNSSGKVPTEKKQDDSFVIEIL